MSDEPKTKPETPHEALALLRRLAVAGIGARHGAFDCPSAEKDQDEVIRGTSMLRAELVKLNATERALVRTLTVLGRMGWTPEMIPEMIDTDAKDAITLAWAKRQP
jgi:hypothetical protein